MKVRWQEFLNKVKNWMNKCPVKPLNELKTIQVLQSSVSKVAPILQNQVFINIFGDITKGYITEDVRKVCEDARAEWIKVSQERHDISKIDFSKLFKAVEITNRQFGLHGRRFETCTWNEVVDQIPKTTSSGAPDFVTPKSEVLPMALGYAMSFMNGTLLLPAVRDFWPIVVNWRTQARETGLKHRIIHAFPHVVSIMEAYFATPFFMFYNDNVGKTWYALGSTWMHNAKFWEHAQENYTGVFEIDWDKFDQSVKLVLMKLFYLNIKQLLILTPNEKIVFDWIEEYHCHANVVTSLYGKPYIIENKLNGVLSGSVFTNFADSWINAVIINYCMLDYNDANIDAVIMGDDIVVAHDKYDSQTLLDHISKVASNEFGMTVSLTKSQIRAIGEPFYFMGFLMNNRFKYMPELLIKRKLIFSERFIKEEDLPYWMVVWSRFCSICSVSSNGYHDIWLPYKDELLERLGIDEPFYFHDLMEGPDKPFSLNRIINNAEDYVRGAWRYC